MNKQIFAPAIMAIGFAAGAQAATTLTGPLPTTFYTTYGDTNAYSLPVFQYITEQANCSQFLGSCTTKDYKVQSAAGLVNDLPVIGTGTAPQGQEAKNAGGMDNAYPTPTGVSGSIYFSTTSVADPGSDVSAPYNDLPGSWDITVSALNNFLQGNELLFFFNNNQDGATGVNLAGWARFFVTGPDGKQVGDTFYLANKRFVNGVDETNGFRPGVYGTELGIDFNDGGDPTKYKGGTDDKPLVIDNLGQSDYVLSGSNYCVDKNNYLPAVCGSANSSPALEHNLGSEEVAYVLHVPELNALLKSLLGNLDQFTLHVDFRMGCEAIDQAGVGTDTAAAGSEPYCAARSLTNGYERFFVGSGTITTTQVPEPGTLLLFAIALAGGVLVRRRVVRR